MTKERKNAITHNYLGQMDTLRVMSTKNGQFARFKINRAGDKPAQYARMPGKTLDRYNNDLANGVFANRNLDFGGYFTQEPYNDKNGERKQRSVFVVLCIRPAKTREEIIALAEAKRVRELNEEVETVSIDFSPFLNQYTPDPALPPNIVDETDQNSWKQHESGWRVRGEVHEDYIRWVDEFEAQHPVWGRVIGNVCGRNIQATSKEAADHFFDAHPIEPVCFDDI